MNLKQLLHGTLSAPEPTNEEWEKSVIELEKAQHLEQAVRDFFKTPLGVHLQQWMDDEQTRALHRLALVDSFDRGAIAEAQEQYKFAQSLRNRLGQAILDGQEATQLIGQTHQQH